MLRVFYNYYYLFYSRVLVQPDPYFVTILALSFTESLWINALIDTVAITAFCIKIDKWLFLSVLVIILLANFRHYRINKKENEIVKSNPKFLGNHTLSIFIVAIVTILGISWLFWGSYLAQSYLKGC